MSKSSGASPSPACSGVQKAIAAIVVFSLLTLFSFLAYGAESDWQNPINGNRDAVARKLLFWLNVTETDEVFGTPELIRFTLENSGWPKLHEFRDRIEKDIGASPHPSNIAAWFDQSPPGSAAGIRDYMGALLRLGHHDKAIAALKKFWLEAELDKKETSTLAGQYRKFFSPTGHIDRLDRLLWEMRYQEAEHMLPLVDAGHGKLAQARIALGRMSSRASKLARAVPVLLQNDEGLLYDRLKWRRQMDKDAGAVDLLKRSPKSLAHAELWWRERNILARRALEKRDYAGAYKIILAHGLTSGVEYSQAEWMLGWLSLRFLGQPGKAYRHFENFYQAVTSAVSRSRAAYWLARAAETLHQEESARNWDKLAAQFPSTFYGQLSREKIRLPLNTSQLPDDAASPDARDSFEGMELVRAIRLLAGIDQMKYAPPFFIKLLNRAGERSDFVMIARLARETNRHYFSVEANKQLQQKLGDFLFTEGYPLLPSLTASRPESALIHAIVHRESMFDTMAASSAGARGLMQLMPATARHVSRNLRKKFNVGKLTENPQYNVELGASYLQNLLKIYSGSYPLAIAAYNAGPGNVDRWLKEFGDPRRGKVDIIDWIEEIPIYETRNYIQRVMESYYIYKLRLSEKPKTVLALTAGQKL